MDAKIIGNKIKSRRTELNMTQKELAAKINVSNQLISKWETGEGLPSLDYVNALCKALEVDLYFFSDDASLYVKEGSEQSGSTGKFLSFIRSVIKKINVKTLIIVVSSVLSAVLITTFVLLSVYVFVPNGNRENYISEIDDSMNAYFARKYYSVNIKYELDGETKYDYDFNGYENPDGSFAFSNTRLGVTFKDNVMTFSNLMFNKDKCKCVQPEDLTFEELIKREIFYDADEENAIDSLDKITYIRKSGGKYYLEFSEELLTEDMSASEKKNIQFTDKIKGEVQTRRGLFVSMYLDCKFRNKKDNEDFTIKSIITFNDEKPIIEHKNLNSSVFSSHYNMHYVDFLPEFNNRVSEKSFVKYINANANLVTAPLNYGVKEAIITNTMKHVDGLPYYIENKKLYILNPDLSVKKTIDINESEYIRDYSIYNGTLYYITNKVGGSSYDYIVKAINIEGGSLINTYYIGYSGTYIMSGKYCYKKSNSKVYDCEINKDFSLNSYSIYNIDSANNAYLRKDNQLYIYKNGQLSKIKGEEYFEAKKSFYLDSIMLSTRDDVYTRDANNVYLYKNGELVTTFTSYTSLEYQAHFGNDYCKLKDGYCERYDNKILNKDGSVKEYIPSYKFYYSGEYIPINGFVFLAIDEKIILYKESINSLILCDANNIFEPLCYVDMSDFDYFRYYGHDMILTGKVGNKNYIAIKSGEGDYDYRFYVY